jgi:BlaI family transcriptional regulator, penicillinase repressor
MSISKRRPTEAELPILRVLWEQGPHTVREIHKILLAANPAKPAGYTTVLKLLQIMTEKGLVTRDESQRPQIYRAAHSEQQTQRQMVGDLLQRVFGGSVKALVLQALATKKSTPEELEAMEKLLDRFETGDKGGEK